MSRLHDPDTRAALAEMDAYVARETAADAAAEETRVAREMGVARDASKHPAARAEAAFRAERWLDSALYALPLLDAASVCAIDGKHVDLNDRALARAAVLLAEVGLVVERPADGRQALIVRAATAEEAAPATTRKPRTLHKDAGYKTRVTAAEDAIVQWVGAGVAGVSFHMGGPAARRTDEIDRAARDLLFATTWPSTGKVPVYAEAMATLAERHGRADVVTACRALAAYVVGAQPAGKAA